MRSNRYREARADKAFARLAFYSGDENMTDLLLYDQSQQGLQLGRVVMIYLFIKFAKCSLEAERSISFLIISSYR